METQSAFEAEIGGPAEEFRELIALLEDRGFCANDTGTYEPCPAVVPQYVVGLSSPLRGGPFSSHDSPPSRRGSTNVADCGSAQDSATSVVYELAGNAAVEITPTAGDVIGLGGNVRRFINIIMNGMLFGPVVVPAQEKLCSVWIERRLGIELDPERPLADALVSGLVLCHLLDLEPRRPGDRHKVPWVLAERNLGMFLERAQSLLMDELVVFDMQDLLYRRNTPRVLRTVAAIARLIDTDAFAAMAAEIPGARIQWTGADEPDEMWDGDWFIRQLVLSFKRLSWTGNMTIVVAGSQGSGKSATVDTIMGRRFMPSSHALGFIPADEEFNERGRRVLQQYRYASALHWPNQLFERGCPVPSEKVCKMYVKIAGVSVQVMELPSMERRVKTILPGGSVSSFQTGTFESVQKDVQRDQVHFLMLVERLDEMPMDRFKHVCRKVHNLYGEKVWSRVVVVLTHGACLPPDRMSFEELVAKRSHEVICCIREVSGDRNMAVPTVVVENSHSCAKNPQTDRSILPNGADFLIRLLNTMEFILAKHQGADAMRPTAPRRWWEDCALVLVAFIILTRI